MSLNANGRQLRLAKSTTAEQPEQKDQPAQETESKELMTIMEAKKVTDPKAADRAAGDVVEKTFQSTVNEGGTSNAWDFYYCSPSQNKVKYLTVKKEKGRFHD